MIMTRDNGLQPLGWVGRSTVDGTGDNAPVAINSTVLPSMRRPLLVSPQHRMLIEDYNVQMLFGDDEVLATAVHMIDGCDVRRLPREKVTYIHLMLDQHEIIYAEGAATESFHLGAQGLMALSDEARDSMYAAYPHLRDNMQAYGPTARRCLKKHETELLMACNHRALMAA